MIKKTINSITNFLMAYTFVCAVLMMLQIVADVVGRYIWQPLPGTFTIVSYWYMSSFIFLPLAYVARERDHISVTFFTDRLGQPWMQIFEIIGAVMTLVIFFVFGCYTWDSAMHAFHIKQFHEDIFNIVTWPASFYLPIGSWAICLQLLLLIFGDCAKLARSE